MVHLGLDGMLLKIKTEVYIDIKNQGKLKKKGSHISMGAKLKTCREARFAFEASRDESVWGAVLSQPKVCVTERQCELQSHP